MSAIRDELVAKLWRGTDPFQDVVLVPDEVDIQGWGSSCHPWFAELLPSLRPAVVVEIGVWKGASTIHMAELMRLHRIDGVVIAVDTWLGAWDHWLTDQWFEELDLQGGRPTLQRRFMNNVVSRGLQDYVLPLPLDSVNAAGVAHHLGLPIDLLHIDAGHDADAVATDLRLWWPLLREGGVLIGDDYHGDGRWPGVKEAFDAFVKEHNLRGAATGGKVRVVKAVEDKARALPLA